MLLAAFLGACSEKDESSRHLERADKLAAKGDFSAARIEYRNVLKHAPQNGRALRQLGSIWTADGAPLRALPYLLRARDQSPSDAAVRMDLARTLRALGKGAEAREEAKAVLEQHPAHEEAVLLLAETARTEEEIRECRAHLEQAGIEPKSGPAYHLALALLAMKESNLTAAESEAQKALALGPDSYHAHLAIARIREAQGSMKAAETALEDAVEFAPTRSHARIEIANFHLRRGDRAKAREVLEAIKAATPGYLPAANSLAMIALRERDLERALKETSHVLARDRSNYDARMLKAQAQLAMGNPTEAVATLEELDAQFPGLPPTKIQLARTYAREGRTGKALATLGHVLERYPMHQEARLLEAQLRLQNGEPAAAIESMSSLLRSEPNLPMARTLLAHAYSAAGRFDEALEIHRARTQEFPENPESHIMVGLIERMRGHADAARTALLRAEELAPGLPLVAAQLIGLDLEAEKPDAARARSERLLEAHPDSAAAHFLKASIEAHVRNWDVAEDTLKKCLQLDPDYGRAYAMLISIYLETERLEEARRELGDFLAKDPDNPAALQRLASIEQQLGDIPAATKNYEAVLAVAPDSSVAQNNLAVLYLAHGGRTEEAYQLAMKARVANPDDAAIADTLGWIVFHRGEYRRALALLEESSSRLGDNPEVLYHLGRARQAMGDVDGARSAYTAALAAAPQFGGRTEAALQLELLDALETRPPPSTKALEDLMARHPKDPVPRLALAASLERAGKSAEAAALYHGALELNPDLLPAHTALARLYSGSLARPEQALAHAKDARALAPEDVAVLATLGASALEAGKADWAYNLLKESTRVDSDDSGILVTLARSAYRTGRAAEAEAVMNRAQELSKGGPEAENIDTFLRMLRLVRDPDRLVAADAEIEEALQRDPARLPALMAGAKASVLKGRQDAAKTAYREILESAPGFSLAQIELAFLLSRSGDSTDLEAAAEMARNLRGRMSGDYRVAVLAAEVCYRQGDFAGAIRHLEEARRHGDLEAEALAILGLSQQGANETVEAATNLRKALDAGLTGPLLEEAQESLPR
ncbi:MAG: tetratricopeptide repeat protein [Akkermansiaceae bacterium]|nr:tetratricopeptide repeat protein [Akkermansiaceae bacterium]